MRKGTQHRPETIEKLRAHWSAVQSASVAEARRHAFDTRIDETRVVEWLKGLDDDEFMRFARDHFAPRVRVIKSS